MVDVNARLIDKHLREIELHQRRTETVEGWCPDCAKWHTILRWDEFGEEEFYVCPDCDADLSETED